MAVAARMFAERPFHEVRLDEIAAAARLGKGTIYVYFSSKDDLYETLIAEGMDQLIAELRGGDGSWRGIERLVQALLAFADRFPHLYNLMRSGVHQEEGRLAHKRSELVSEIERVLRAGIRSGELRDPQPRLTAEFLLAFVRAALLFTQRRVGKRTLTRHILHVVGNGILTKRR